MTLKRLYSQIQSAQKNEMGELWVIKIAEFHRYKVSSVISFQQNTLSWLPCERKHSCCKLATPTVSPKFQFCKHHLRCSGRHQFSAKYLCRGLPTRNTLQSPGSHTILVVSLKWRTWIHRVQPCKHNLRSLGAIISSLPPQNITISLFKCLKRDVHNPSDLHPHSLKWRTEIHSRATWNREKSLDTCCCSCQYNPSQTKYYDILMAGSMIFLLASWYCMNCKPLVL